LVQKSCEKEVVALMVSPATTARIVANAIEEMNAKKIFPAVSLDEVGAYDRRSSEPEERGHDVEAADQHHCPYHAVARRLGVRHSVEPDKNVRQSCGSEDQRESQRDQIQRPVRLLETKTRLQKVFYHRLALGIVI
jgi:hypothetical protein